MPQDDRSAKYAIKTQVKESHIFTDLHFTKRAARLPVHQTQMPLLPPYQHVPATATEVYVVRAKTAKAQVKHLS